MSPIPKKNKRHENDWATADQTQHDSRRTPFQTEKDKFQKVVANPGR